MLLWRNSDWLLNSFSNKRLNLYPDEFDSKFSEEWFDLYQRGRYNVEINGETPLRNMASKMNTLRNNMAHGNLDIQLEKSHFFGFSIIEALLYAMRLKSLGIEEKKIQNGITQIMGYNLRLD